MYKNRKWILFDYNENGHLITLKQASYVSIKYHTYIRGKANPYDPVDERYFEQRKDKQMLDKIEGRKMLTFLFNNQHGMCPVCQHKITKQTGWDAHHVVPKHLGGKYVYANLVLLHPFCHLQVHNKDSLKAQKAIRTAALNKTSVKNA